MKMRGIIVTGLLAGCFLATQAGEISVTASAFESKERGGFADFPPEKTLDGDLSANSSWRVEVADAGSGEWIQYDLGAVQKISSIKVFFLSGSKRSYQFKIETSAEGQMWSEVFSGASGGLDGFEEFDAKGAEARYVRLTGCGNTGIGAESPFPKWFNIVETRIVTPSSFQ